MTKVASRTPASTKTARLVLAAAHLCARTDHLHGLPAAELVAARNVARQLAERFDAEILRRNAEVGLG